MRWHDDIRTQWHDDSEAACEVYTVNGCRVDDETLWDAYAGLLGRAGYWPRQGSTSWFSLARAWKSPGEPMVACPFCNTRLSVRRCTYHEPSDLSPVARLSWCPLCCYWEAYREEPSEGWLDGDDTAPVYVHMAMSKLAEFPASLPIGCESELAQWLRRHPNKWCALSPRRLEELVATVFKANHAHCEVLHVGKPNDGGVDVLFIDSTSTRWLVQVKRRSDSNASEGVETLRNLLGAMVLNATNSGIVVSTADHFTYRALLGQARARSMGYEIGFVDRAILSRMLDPMLPDRPWLDFLSEYPELAKYFGDRLPSRCQLSLFADSDEGSHQSPSTGDTANVGSLEALGLVGFRDLLRPGRMSQCSCVEERNQS